VKGRSLLIWSSCVTLSFHKLEFTIKNFSRMRFLWINVTIFKNLRIHHSSNCKEPIILFIIFFFIFTYKEISHFFNFNSLLTCLIFQKFPHITNNRLFYYLVISIFKALCFNYFLYCFYWLFWTKFSSKFSSIAEENFNPAFSYLKFWWHKFP